MNTDVIRACLFGGLMCGAGIVGADEFVVASTSVAGSIAGPYVLAYDAPVVDFDNGEEFGFGGVTATAGGTSSDVKLTASEFDVRNAKPDGATSLTQAIGETDFGVTATGVATIQWKVDAPIALDTFRVVRPASSAGPSAVLFDYGSLPAGQQGAGTANVVLEGGTAYRLEFSVGTQTNDKEYGFTVTLPPPPPECAADCDDNGILNLDDLDCFVTSFLGGCP